MAVRLPAPIDALDDLGTPVPLLGHLGLLAAATIILGFYQGPLGAWVSWR